MDVVGEQQLYRWHDRQRGNVGGRLQQQLDEYYGRALGNPQSATNTVTVNGGATLLLAVGNVFGNGTSTPLAGVTVNQGGTLLIEASNVGGSGGGDCNSIGPLMLNGATVVTANGFSVNYQAAVLTGGVTVGGSSPSFISSVATNAIAGGVMLSGTTTFSVASTGVAPDLTVSAPLVWSLRRNNRRRC